MTGEITLRGRVLPIGGLKEKTMAAHRAGIKHVLAPKLNKKDLVDIPKAILKRVDVTFVEHMDEVLSHALEQGAFVDLLSRVRAISESPTDDADVGEPVTH